MDGIAGESCARLARRRRMLLGIARKPFASIAPYTIEEAYEVGRWPSNAAICRRSRDELGDFAVPSGFSFNDGRKSCGNSTSTRWAGAICDKLKRRHPHVFGRYAGPHDGASSRLSGRTSKAEERGPARRRGAIWTGFTAGVCPALMRAHKLRQGARPRVGIRLGLLPIQTATRWPKKNCPKGCARAARKHQGDTPHAEVFEEVGDLLFAAANLGTQA